MTLRDLVADRCHSYLSRERERDRERERESGSHVCYTDSDCSREYLNTISLSIIQTDRCHK